MASTHEYIEYASGDLEGLLDTAVTTGIIVSVDYDADTAVVDIAGIGVVSGVPIFYHCAGSEAVAGGSAAFSAGDSVYVLNKGGDLTITGFVGGLKNCRCDLDAILGVVKARDYESFNPSLIDLGQGCYLTIETLLLERVYWKSDYFHTDTYNNIPEDVQLPYMYVFFPGKAGSYIGASLGRLPCPQGNQCIYFLASGNDHDGCILSSTVELRCQTGHDAGDYIVIDSFIINILNHNYEVVYVPQAGYPTSYEACLDWPVYTKIYYDAYDCLGNYLYSHYIHNSNDWQWPVNCEWLYGG